MSVSLTTVIALIKKLSSSISPINTEKINTRQTEFIAPSNTGELENQNWRIIPKSDGLLYLERLENDIWIKKQTVGSSITTDNIYVEGVQAGLVFLEPDGTERKITNHSPNDTLWSLGDEEITTTIVSDVQPKIIKKTGVIKNIVLNNLADVVANVTEVVFNYTSDAGGRVQDITLNTGGISSARLLIKNLDDDVIVYETCTEFDFYNNNRGIGIPSGVQTINLSRVARLLSNTNYEFKIQSLEPSDINGHGTVGVDFIPYLTYNLIEVEFNDVLSADSIVGVNGINISYDTVNDTMTISQQVTEDTGEPTGFVNRTDSSISVTNDVFTLSVPTSCDYYIKANKYTTAEDKSLTISDIEGSRYIYIDENGELQQITSFDMNILFKDNAYISALYWDADNGKQIYLADERHGITMDWATHSYLHTTFGARYISGLGLSDFTVDGDGSLDAHCQFAYDSGVMNDEDIRHMIPAQSFPANIPIYYKEGSTPVIRRKEPNTFPLIGKNDITPTARPKYNLETAGVWSLAEPSTNELWMIHYFATNDVNNPVVGFLGTNVYTSATQARIEANTEMESLSGLPFEEFTPIGTVIFKTDSYSNTENAVIISTDIGGNYVDFRGQSSQFSGGTSPSIHNDLTNRDAENTHPSNSISYDNSLSGLTSTDVKHAIDEVKSKTDNNRTAHYYVEEGGDDSNDGGINNPFLTLTQAISTSLSGTSSVIEIGKGTFAETIGSLDKLNLSIKGQATRGSFSTTINGKVELDSTMTRFRMKDIQLDSDVATALDLTNSDLGRHVFENVYFGSTLASSLINVDGMQNFITFQDCSINGRITISNSTATFNIIGNTNPNLEIVLNSNATVYIVDSLCTSITNNSTGSVFIIGASSNPLNQKIATFGTGNIQFLGNPYIQEQIEFLASPTFVASDSTDPDITYGGFSTTGLIRKRVISTGVDTFFQSAVSLPVINPNTWTDWQNRETLIYA